MLSNLVYKIDSHLYLLNHIVISERERLNVTHANISMKTEENTNVNFTHLLNQEMFPYSLWITSPRLAQRLRLYLIDFWDPLSISRKLQRLLSLNPMRLPSPISRRQ